MAVRHLFHIPAIKVLHGFQCLVAVGYEAEEQARFRRFNPDQKKTKQKNVLIVVLFLLLLTPSPQKKKTPKQSSLHDARRIDSVVCGVLQESSGISAQIWPSFTQGSGPDLIWSLFSENGTAADALTEAPIYNPVSPLVLKLS